MVVLLAALVVYSIHGCSDGILVVVNGILVVVIVVVVVGCWLL